MVKWNQIFHSHQVQILNQQSGNSSLEETSHQMVGWLFWSKELWRKQWTWVLRLAGMHITFSFRLHYLCNCNSPKWCLMALVHGKWLEIHQICCVYRFQLFFWIDSFLRPCIFLLLKSIWSLQMLKKLILVLQIYTFNNLQVDQFFNQYHWA